MLNGVCWKELTYSSCYDASFMLDGTEWLYHLWYIVCAAWNWESCSSLTIHQQEITPILFYSIFITSATLLAPNNNATLLIFILFPILRCNKFLFIYNFALNISKLFYHNSVSAFFILCGSTKICKILFMSTISWWLCDIKFKMCNAPCICRETSDLFIFYSEEYLMELGKIN